MNASSLTKAQRKALQAMAAGDGRMGVNMFEGRCGGPRLAMLRALRLAGFCDPLWMDEWYWRITNEGRAALATGARK